VCHGQSQELAVDVVPEPTRAMTCAATTAVDSAILPGTVLIGRAAAAGKHLDSIDLAVLPVLSSHLLYVGDCPPISSNIQ